MTLINLTKEFSSGSLEFLLPNLDDSFIRLHVIGITTSAVDSYTLLVELNGGGSGHYYRNDVYTENLPSGQSTIVRNTSSIDLGMAPVGQNGSGLNSDITISLIPGSSIISLQAQTNGFGTGTSISDVPFRRTMVTGGRAGTTALNSIGVKMYRQNTTSGTGVSGWARLFYYPHIVNLQAEI